MNAKWTSGGYKTGKVLVQAIGGTRLRVFASNMRCDRYPAAAIQLIANGHVVFSASEKFTSKSKRDAYLRNAWANGAINDLERCGGDDLAGGEL